MSEKNEMLALADAIEACTNSSTCDHLMGANVPLIVSALRAGASVSKWQPIETAPTDKPVWGYQATPGDFEGQMATCNPLKIPGSFAVTWMGPGGLMPTHWMPLPQPPETTR